MSSQIELANRALEQVGADAISSLDDDSKPARLCKRLFPQLRDAMLRAHPWPFASARANLPALAAAPAFGWRYAYQLPSDCLRVTHLQNGWQLGFPRDWCSDSRYAIEGRQLLTDASAPLPILYTRRVTDPVTFDVLFDEALVMALAANLAMPMTNDKSFAQGLRQDQAAAMATARGIANVEAGIHREYPTPALVARRW